MITIGDYKGYGIRQHSSSTFLIYIYDGKYGGDGYEYLGSTFSSIEKCKEQIELWTSEGIVSRG